MKILRQHIIETLGDRNYGSHQEKSVWDDKNKHFIKPDWLYTFDTNMSAIIIEDKEKGDVGLDKAIDQLHNKYYPVIKNYGYKNIITIACKQDKKSGIIMTKNFKNKKFIDDVLHSLNWYKDYLNVNEKDDGYLWDKNRIIDEIYSKTKQINNILHHHFRIKHLQDRMLYTGCLLIASKWSNGEMQDFENIIKLKNFVCENIDNAKKDKKIEIRNSKLDELKKSFSSIDIGINPNPQIIHTICENCNAIIKIYNRSPFCEIDIMNIFFIEFNRYRGKSEHGQVFTPDHIANLMAELINIEPNDNILDPCCGGGITTCLFQQKW